MTWRGWVAAVGLFTAASLCAAEKVAVCYNYGCLSQAEVTFDDAQLSELRAVFAPAVDAATERFAVGLAIGALLGWAGGQTPISADRGGNYEDQMAYGRMDCIDHSTTTTRLLHLLARQGLLRFHRVLESVVRQRFIFAVHHSAQIEELVPAVAGEALQRFVVDSWFYDNGQPAAVMPLARWLAGDDPK